ncbi:hypothetical protein DFH06DRAFT_1213997 [Mycena polygramma]|nr:hypothetical protein DFH06DRAFT_1213997 [Mycena polygramma]
MSCGSLCPARKPVYTYSVMNPDMQGYIVRISNFVTHIGVAMLIAWSDKKNPRSYYAMLFLQIVFILIGVLACIRRDQLSIDDAEFAVTLTRSPICAYCVCLVLPRLFVQALRQKARSAFKNLQILFSFSADRSAAWNALIGDLKCRPVFDGFCAILVLLLALALNLSVQFNHIIKLYTVSQCSSTDCLSEGAPGMDTTHIVRWLGVGGISLVVYELVLTRHQRLRWELMGRLAARKPSSKKTFYWKRGVCGICATWYITVKLHPWIPFFYTVILFEDWARKLKIWKVEQDFVFSYGQFLAIGPAVPVAWECVALALRRRAELAQIPRFLMRDVVWIVSGTGRPWGGEELRIKDVWEAFPADVLRVEPGLPLQMLDTTGTQITSANCGTRCRTQRVRRKSRRGGPPVLEVDLGEVNLPSFLDCTIP